MTWVSKFSGLPTDTDIPDAADSYLAGVFTIDTATSTTNRDWNNTGGNTNAPRAYVTLASIGTTVAGKMLRIAARCSAISIATELNSRRGVALYGPGADDACLAFILEDNPPTVPGQGDGYGRAEENGTTTDLGPDALTSCGVPNQFRLYWNDTPEDFEIPDAGFGSHVVVAQTCSYWYSEDDGTTWVNVGDRAIDGGVIPTRAAIWAGIDYSSGETLTTTFSALDVDEYDFPPQIANENPEDGQVYWDVSQNLYLEAIDPFYFDVDDATVEIWLDDTPVWTGDAQQPGFTVTKTQIPAGLDILGWSYLINPSSDLVDGRKYKLRARAENSIGTAVDQEWMFTAGDLNIGREEDAEENHLGATPQSVMGFQDGDALGEDIVDMIGPPNATGRRWLPGIGGGVDMPGPVGKASFAISYNQAFQPVGPHDTMGFADYDLYGFYTGVAGPENYLLSILPAPEGGPVNRGSGISIQGPLLKQAENFEDPAWHDHAGFADGCDFPQNTGGRTYHNWPHEGRGLTLYDRGAVDGRDPPQEEASFEDGLFYSMTDLHEYMAGILDGDGNDLAGGYGIEQVQTFEGIDLDAWATPGVAGFYGYSKAGTLYHNGLATQPGVFGAGAGQFNRRSWSDNQGLLASGTIDGDAAMVGVDQLRINSIGLAASTDLVQGNYRWWLPSDFEITIDFSGFSSPSGSAVSARLEMWADNGYAFLAGVRGDSVYERYTKINGTWGNNVTAGAVGASGSLKVSRVGTTIHTYYYSGGWVEIGSGVDMGRADRMFVRVCCTGTGDIDITWSNLQIVSGGWTNKASWAAEAFSTERGNADAFPDNVLVIGTELGLDIVDTDNDLLWMRFIKGTNKLIHNDLAHPLDSVFKDGILLVANNAEGNNEGSLEIIDFNLDAARIARQDAAAETGGFFDGPSGQRSLGPGTLAFRNLASGFSGDYPRWSTGSGAAYNIHNAVDLLLKSGKVYAVGGSDEGMTVFRWTRWNLDEWITNVDAAYWLSGGGKKVYWVWFRPQDDMLFWVADDAGDITIYSQTLANLELPMHGGSFLAQNDKVMPGTRSEVFLGQYRPAINGSDVYVAADDAVWKMAWPGSSWTRFFGKPGSGATHEVLPAKLTRVTAVRHMKDGSIDLLAVGVDTGVTSQVLVFRLDLGTLYAKTRLLGARSTSSLTAA